MVSHSDRLSIDHALLGFLVEGPRHGYDIYRELSDPNGLWVAWRIKQSQLYALLSRLDDEGCLESHLEPQEGRPPRKMYALTTSGRRLYDAWLRAPVEHGRQFRLDVLAKLFFARREGEDVLEDLLEGQRRACDEWLKELECAHDDTPPGRLFERLVHRYRAGQVRAMLDWLAACSDEMLDPTPAP